MLALLKRWLLVGCVFVLIIAAMPFAAPARAQSDEALARIDQAMRHLSNHVGQLVTRDANQWRWTESIFPDTSLDCPAQGIVYSQQQTRGFQVWITVEGVEYDYRLPATSEAIILCVNGHPDSSSTGIALPPLTPEEQEVVDSIERPLESAAWWAWAYVIDTDTLYLLSPEGEQARLPRPRLPNEMPGGTPKMAFSRDGQTLVVAARLNSGIEGIGFYSVQTGQFIRIHEVGANEVIYLGFGYDNSAIAGSPYIANTENSLLAIGLANTDFLSPSWRVIVFDLNRGDALYQLDNRNPLVSAYVPTDGSILFPRIVYFDTDAVHVQLIRFAAGAAESYPAFVWHPNANFVEPSPYNLTNIDILPTDESAAFAYIDASQPIALSPVGALNAVGVGQPNAPEQIYLNSGLSQSVPRWVGGGTSVVFKSLDGTNNEYWNGITLTNNTPFPIDPTTEAVVGTPEGYLTRSNTGAVMAFDAADIGSPLWQAPEGTESVILWSLPPGSSFAPTSVFVPLNLTGIVNCPNTLPSVVAIGLNAQVVDGATLRLRETAGGEYLFTMVEGTQFRVIAGPQCQGEYTWWQVRLRDDSTGWAAEGDSGGYYMEPVDES